MFTFEYENKQYSTDKNGFLQNPDHWDEGFAEGVAKTLNIPGGLTDEHWKVIKYIRNRYLKNNACPVIFDALKNNNISLEKMKALFPTGYQRGACKIAGVTYLDGYLSYHYMDKVIKSGKPYSPDKTYVIDSHGFLTDPSEWDESFAVNKADELKMPHLLTDRHWELIYYLRDKFEKSNTVPTVYEACRDMKMGIDEFGLLFPDGYHRGAIKIAGLRIR